MEVDVSPHNRASHKFHVGQLVEFGPKKRSPISSAHGAYEILRNKTANCNIGLKAQPKSTSVLLLRAN